MKVYILGGKREPEIIHGGSGNFHAADAQRFVHEFSHTSRRSNYICFRPVTGLHSQTEDDEHEDQRKSETPERLYNPSYTSPFSSRSSPPPE